MTDGLRKFARKRRAELFTSKYWLVLTLTGVSVGLVVGSFISPPPGVIDMSVITAVGELFAFAALVVFVIRAEAGADVTFQKGDVMVSLHNEDPSSGIPEDKQ